MPNSIGKRGSAIRKPLADVKRPALYTVARYAIAGVTPGLATLEYIGGISSMVELLASNQLTAVRFRYAAPSL